MLNRNQLFLKREYFKFKFNYWWYRESKNILTAFKFYRILNMQSKHNACSLERLQFFFIILCNANLIYKKDFHSKKYKILCFACLLFCKIWMFWEYFLLSLYHQKLNLNSKYSRFKKSWFLFNMCTLKNSYIIYLFY